MIGETRTDPTLRNTVYFLTKRVNEGRKKGRKEGRKEGRKGGRDGFMDGWMNE